MKGIKLENYEGVIHGLRYAVLNDVRAYPLAFSSSSGSVRGGILSEGMPEYALQMRGNGLGDKRSMTRFRHNDPSGMMTNPKFEEVSGTSLYLGPLFKHFGHFLTESFSRAWFLEYGNIPWEKKYFLPQSESVEERNSLQYSGIKDWRSTALELLDITDYSLITTPMRFEKLIVPEQGSILFSDFHHETYLEFLKKRIENHYPFRPPTRKVYFSRLQQGSSVAGERYLERFLATQGYEVIIPENLSFEDQVSLARETKIATGVQGSAFHIFNMFGSSPTKILTIKRQGHRTTEGFIASLKPFVSSCDLVPDLGKVSSTDQSEIALLDIASFLKKLREIDNLIHIEDFEWDKFYKEIAMQIRASEE